MKKLKNPLHLAVTAIVLSILSFTNGSAQTFIITDDVSGCGGNGCTCRTIYTQGLNSITIDSETPPDYQSTATGATIEISYKGSVRISQVASNYAQIVKGVQLAAPNPNTSGKCKVRFTIDISSLSTTAVYSLIIKYNDGYKTTSRSLMRTTHPPIPPTNNNTINNNIQRN